MPLTSDEVAALIVACSKLPLGPDYRVNDYVKNVINTVLDFQMDSSVVGKSMDYFELHHKARSHRKLVSLMAVFPDTKAGNLRLAQHL